MNGQRQNERMSNPIGLLLADDSAVVRRVLTEAVEAEPRLKMVGTAKNGTEAVGLFPTCRPDVILLDVEMPTMDGIEAVAAIRKLNSEVPILMFSSLAKGGEATLDALIERGQQLRDEANSGRTHLGSRPPHSGKPVTQGHRLGRTISSGQTVYLSARPHRAK